MYQPGERVVYGIHGVCDVHALDQQRVDGKQVTYLVLEPLGQSGSRFLVPTHNVNAMAKVKPLLTRQELEALLHQDSLRQDCWINEENQRKQTYRELISSGDRQRILAMVHSLYCHKAVQGKAGRKIHLCDENFLRDAEKLLAGEIALVLEMPQEEARQYLRDQLSRETKS